MGAAADILTEAHGLVRGERLQHYGPPTKNFARIAGQWTAYLGIEEQVDDVRGALASLEATLPERSDATEGALAEVAKALAAVNPNVTPDDVCCLMILLKVARIRTGGSYHRDSAVDAAGYAALLEILNEEEAGANA